MAREIDVAKLNIDHQALLDAQGELIQQMQELREQNKKLKKDTGGLTDATEDQAKAYAANEAQITGLNKKYQDQKKVLAQAQTGVKQKTGFVQKMSKAYAAATLAVGAAVAAIAGLVKGVQAYVKGQMEFLKQQTKVTQMFQTTRKEAAGLTKDIRATAKAFDVEFNDVLKSSSVLANEFGISGKEALGLIEEGFLKGANVNGEFLELLKEYPAQLKSVGLSAEETIAIITQTEREGVFSDKGIDAIKEAGLRLREMTPATEAALEMIGISATELKNNIQNGTITMFEAIQQVTTKMGELPEASTEVGTAIADIFGGPGEDAGLRFLTTLGGMEVSLENIESNLSEAEKAQIDLSKKWSQFKDLLFGGEQADSAFTKIQEAIIGVLDWMINLKKEGGVLMATFQFLWEIVKLVFKNIFLAFKTTVVEPITAGNKIIKAAFRGDWDEVKSITSEFFDDTKDNLKQFVINYADAGKNVVDAYKGFTEEMEEESAKQTKAMTTPPKKQVEGFEKAKMETLEIKRKETHDIIDLAEIAEKAVVESSENVAKAVVDNSAAWDEYFNNLKINAKEAFKQFSGVSIDALNLLADVNQQNLDKKLAGIDQEIQAIEASLDSEKDKATKISRLQKEAEKESQEAAERDKKLKIAQAAINGASAILAAFAINPFLGAATAALVGFQLKFLGAQQLPDTQTKEELKKEMVESFDFAEELRKRAEERARIADESKRLGLTESEVIREQLKVLEETAAKIREASQRAAAEATTREEKQAAADRGQAALQLIREERLRLQALLEEQLLNEFILDPFGTGTGRGPTGRSTSSGARGRRRGFAKGGQVPLIPGSQKGADSVPALLTPFEEIATVRAAQSYPGLVKAMNEGQAMQWFLNHTGNTDNVGINQRLDRLNSTLRKKQMVVINKVSSGRHTDHIKSKYGYVGS